MEPGRESRTGERAERGNAGELRGAASCRWVAGDRDRGALDWWRGWLAIAAVGYMVSVSAEHIAITPDVCNGKPQIAGHRIRVQDIAI